MKQSSLWRRIIFGAALIGICLGAYWLGRRADPVPLFSNSPEVVTWGQPMPGFLAAPMIEPTPPVPLKQLVPPWAPHRALVLAFPPSFIFENPERLELAVNLIEVAVDYVDVIVLVPLDRSEIESLLLERWSRDERGAKVRKRVQFLPSSAASAWVRDYLPQYGWDKEGHLVMIDARTVGVTGDPSAWIQGWEADKRSGDGKFARQLSEIIGDDLAPGYLANHLRTEYRYALKEVRPPLALDGGDFVPLGNGELALSASTLRYQGGREEVLRLLLRQYYGIQRVHILPTLPGRTIDHLDFILQGVSDRVLLVARPPSLPTLKQLYANMIGERTAAILRSNLEYLRRELPDHQIIEVPMPPPLSASDEDIRSEIRQAIEYNLCQSFGVDYAAFRQGPRTQVGQQALKILARVLQENFDGADLRTTTGLDQMARQLLGQPLEILERRYVDQFTVYRTYLNSTVIKANDGRTLVLLPRYRPRNEKEAAIFPTLERDVMSAYREALPGARLEWLDCDSIIGELGAVHCLTHLVPWAEARAGRN